MRLCTVIVVQKLHEATSALSNIIPIHNRAKSPAEREEGWRCTWIEYRRWEERRWRVDGGKCLLQQKRRPAGVSMADGGNCLERNTAGFQRLLLAPHPFNLASPSISWQRLRTLLFCVRVVVWRHSRISLEGCPDCTNVVASSPERISGQRAAATPHSRLPSKTKGRSGSKMGRAWR